MDTENKDNWLGLHGMKVAIGSGMSVFLIGSIFWAGATYNRIQSIETHLLSIDSAMSKISDIETVDERTKNIEKHLDKLEDSVNKIEMDQKFK